MNDMVMDKIKVSCEIKMYIWRQSQPRGSMALVAGFIWRETGSQGNSAAHTAQTSSTTRAQLASCCRLTQPSHREIPQHCLPFLLQVVLTTPLEYVSPTALLAHYCWRLSQTQPNFK